jgi:two-component system response regulator NreC
MMADQPQATAHGRTSVLIVDDHTMVRHGFRRLLETAPDIEIVGEAADGTSAVELARQLQPTVVLMDVAMPSMDGIQATRAILEACPATRILILTMHADDVYVRQSLKAGAHGYVLKDADDLDLAHAIRAVARGDAFFSSEVATMLREGWVQGSGRAVEDNLSLLTEREREILRRIAEGETNRAIATRLGVTVNTVDSHRKHIMEKLGLHNTADLVRFAVRRGVVG